MEHSCNFEVDVTAKEVAAFAELSGDRNPLHIDAEYARGTEYGQPIVHGAFLVGLVSRVLGMHIPGERSVLLSLSVRFPKPLFYPARVQVAGRLKHFDADRVAGAVQVTIDDVSRRATVLEAEALFGLHAARSAAESHPSTQLDARPAAQPAAGGRPRLLVTGGTGGIGRQVVGDLASAYDVTVVSRGSDPPARATVAQVDLEAPESFERFLDGCNPHDFYGVLHLSVPPMARAFASDDLPGVRRHLRHGVEVPLLLAAWARRSGSSVKRIVLVGSTSGLQRPRPEVGAYSLGKAAMEQLVPLLTADLAAQGATVNIVLPSLVPVGLNDGLSERARKTLVAQTPTGRLVEPGDIAGVVAFLLSPSASQVNGATISVDGGSRA